MWLTKNYVMNLFAKDVKVGKYKKLDYTKWRTLRDATPEGWEIDIEVRHELGASEKNPVKAVVSWQHCIAPYEFPIGDNSFGRFLYDLLKPYLENPYSVDITTVSNAMTETAKSVNTASHAVYQLQDSWDSAITYGIADLNDIKANTDIQKREYTFDFGNGTVAVSEDGLFINGKKIEHIIDETVGHSINRKENDNMNLFKGFDFGSCENDNVKMSMYGIAVKNATGTWVSYDSNSGNIIDVDILNFDAKYLYKMPVAIKDVAEGEVIIHNRKPMFVSKVEGSKILAIDPAAGEEKVVILTRNMFGFDFVTKVVNLFGNLSATANADAPFGNILPLMLLSDSNKSDDMLPLIFAMNGGKFDMSNPMMLYFLMKNDNNSDMLPLLMLANGGFGAPAAVTNSIAP